MVEKRMLLVYPKNLSLAYTNIIQARMGTTFRRSGGYLINSLATVAALTPPEIEVSIIDENVEPIAFDKHYDLVGITGLTFHVPRAKKIAQEFSKRGVLVVCGGPSATLSPDRWRPFADVLILGEAERIWPQFCKDYLAGQYAPEYRETERFDLSLVPIPDYSGYSRDSLQHFSIGTVQTCRGCPYNCEFCSVHEMSGHKMRFKPLHNIIQEVEQLHKMGLASVMLADDNLPAGREKATAVLHTLRDWNKERGYPLSFAAGASIESAQNDEFLKLAAEAGVNKLNIGIESPNLESLKEAHKLHNIKSDMLESIKKFHQYGILVLGSTIVGFDHDDLSIFQQQFDFFMNAGTPFVFVFPLQALDGTRLKKRMIEEGRYINWEEILDNTSEENYLQKMLEESSIIPKQMTLEELRQGTFWLAWNLYKHENLVKRLEKFFADFKGSPWKDQLAIPRGKLNARKMRILWGTLKYLCFRSSAAERKRFRQLAATAKRSSYPRRIEAVLTTFFMGETMRDVLVMLNPQVDQVTYPAKR